MLLSVGITILASPVLSVNFCDYANNLLVLFVEQAEVLYGKDILVYNVDNLIHLAQDVNVLGCLDEFSAFPFENMLGQLKKLVKKPQHPIQQIVRRLTEKENVRTPSVCFVVEGNLCLSPNNNCVKTVRGSYARVTNILQEKNGNIVLLCQDFLEVSNAFENPLFSLSLGICKVSDKLSKIYPLNICDVVQKCACFPFCEKLSFFVIVPLLHCE